MIRTINTSNPINYVAAIAGANKVGAVAKVNIPDAPLVFSSGTFENNIFNRPNPSWGLGAGLTISGANQRIFYNESAGGALADVTLVNKSTGVVYVCFNTTGFNLANSIPLEYNESIDHAEKITQIWANAPSGNSVLIGNGLMVGWQSVGVNN